MAKPENNQKKAAFISGELIAFIVLIAVQTLPVFYFQYFPNWDGPSHLGTAAALSSYQDPGIPIFREYFKINWLPAPNLLGHFALILLLKFLTPIWAEKFLVILILILFPVSVRYCMVSLDPGAKYLSFLAIPLANNWFVHAGFYNFSLSLCLFFLALGYWLRNRERLGLWEILICSLLLVLTYLSHIMSWLMLLSFLFGFILLRYAGKLAFRENLTKPPSITQALREMGWIVIASIPSLILAVIYFLTAKDETNISRLPVLDLIKDLGTLRSVMLVFHRWDYLFSILLSLTILSLAVYVLIFHISKTGRYQRLTYLVFPLALTVLYFAAPNSLAEGSFLNSRLVVFIYLALLIWLTDFKVYPFIQRTVIAISTIAMLGLMSMRIPFYASFNADMAEYLSAGPMLEKNSTILPLYYIYDGVHADDEGDGTAAEYSLRTRPLDHAAGYLMANYGVVDLAHYESAFDYFPLQFRPELNPFVYLGSGSRWTEYIPPNVNITNYSQQSIGRVDYVLTWGVSEASEEVLSDPATVLVLNQLTADYDLIFVSEPRGLMHLYKRLDD